MSSEEEVEPRILRVWRRSSPVSAPWSLAVAVEATSKLHGADTGEDLRQTLRILGSTSSSELLALEVIWQPEGRGDVLSAEELITAYPNLQHL